MAGFETPTAKHIEELARTFGVKYERRAIDDLAQKFTELSGDVVRRDEVLNLLVALRRAGVVTAREMSRFAVLHLRERAALSADSSSSGSVQ